MGHRKVPTIYTLTEIKGEEGAVVRMKAIKIGKLRKLMRVISVDEKDMTPAMLDEIFSLLLEGLVSWNLEYEQGHEKEGQPLPTTMEGVDELELTTLMNILNEWLENMTGVDDELGKGSPSGENFPGRPLTMEAL